MNLIQSNINSETNKENVSYRRYGIPLALLKESWKISAHNTQQFDKAWCGKRL